MTHAFKINNLKIQRKKYGKIVKKSGENMAYVEIGLERYHTGKRKKNYYTKEYDISDDLWEQIQKFAEENEFCSIGKWDWNKGTLYMHRMKELDEIFKEYSKAPSDYEVLHEIQKELFGSNINMKEMQFKYEYIKKVISVDIENRTCTVEKKMAHADFMRYIDKHHKAPPTKTYEVAISDRCIYEKIKPKDEILIRKFFNNVHLAVKVVESYKEPTRAEIEEQLKEFDELIEEY